MKKVKCMNCGKEFILKKGKSFRKNGLIFIGNPDEPMWNSFRCKCGVVIEENYEEIKN